MITKIWTSHQADGILHTETLIDLLPPLFDHCELPSQRTGNLGGVWMGRVGANLWHKAHRLLRRRCPMCSKPQARRGLPMQKHIAPPQSLKTTNGKVDKRKGRDLYMHKLVIPRFALPIIVLLALITLAIIAFVLLTHHVHIPGTAYNFLA